MSGTPGTRPGCCTSGRSATRLGDLAGHESIDWHVVAAEIATPSLAEMRYHIALEIMFNALASLLGKGLPRGGIRRR